jgi:hypothetical protein
MMRVKTMQWLPALALAVVLAGFGTGERWMEFF